MAVKLYFVSEIKDNYLFQVKMWFSNEENEPSSFADDGYNRMKELHYVSIDHSFICHLSGFSLSY